MTQTQWLLFFLLILLAIFVLYRDNKLSINPTLKALLETLISKPGLKPTTGGNNGKS